MEELKMKTLFVYYNPNDPEEVFAKAVYNNQVVPDYYVSNKGRVWTVRWNRFLSQSPDKDGYLRVTLVINDKGKTVKVHRLVMMTFHPIMNPDDYVVNHLYGTITKNYDNEMEWTTVLGNTRHGWDTGLNHNKGEGAYNTYLKDEQVHEICSLLEKGYHPNDICNHFKIEDKKERMRMSAIVSSIEKCKSYRDISMNYDIKGSKGRDRYSLEFAHIVCNFLYNSDGVQHTDEQIMDYLQIPEIDRVKFKVYLSDLRKERTAKDIVKYYKDKFNQQ